MRLYRVIEGIYRVHSFWGVSKIRDHGREIKGFRGTVLKGDIGLHRVLADGYIEFRVSQN